MINHQKQIYTHAQTKFNNRAMVLKLICTGEADSRAVLTRKTGLSKMAVSNIVAELLEEELVCEVGRNSSNSPQGRKPVKVEVSPKAPYVAGIFVSRNACGIVICDLLANICRHESLKLPLDSDVGLAEALLELYRQVTHDLDRPVWGVGIASIGPVDKANGVILNPPDFYGICDIPIRDYFAEQLGLPVFFDNNMNASALAENLFGHGKELTDFVYVGVLRGIGAGVISNGNLLQGVTGINGEIGHTSIKFDGPLCACGNRGCLELYASLPIVVEDTARRMLAANVTPQDIFDWTRLVELARQGDYYCLRALDRLCESLSVGLVNLVNLFDCEAIFLGHDIAQAEGLIESKLEEWVNERIFAAKHKRVTIRMSAFGQHAPLVGAACLVLEHVFSGQMQSLPEKNKKETANEEIPN